MDFEIELASMTLLRRAGISDGKLVAAFLREKDGATIGGLFGWTWGATCEAISLS